MNQMEIRKRIDENNASIERIFRPNVFTLNNIVADLLRQNAALQDKCKHEYEENYCIYCDKEKV